MRHIHTFPWWELPNVVVLKALERAKDEHSRRAALLLLSIGVRDPYVIAAVLLHHALKAAFEGLPEEVWEIAKGERPEGFLVKMACAWERGKLKGLKPPRAYLPLYLSALIRAKEEGL